MITFAKKTEMKNTDVRVDPAHPYIRQLDAIAQKGVVVIDDIPGPPSVGEPYIASNLLIIVCHQGAIINDHAEEFALHAHDISILMPDQIAIPLSVTQDFRATNVAVSKAFYERLHQCYPYTRYSAHFRRRPPCHLTEEQFACALDLVNLIRNTSRSESKHRQEMLMQLISILLNMLGEYHVKNYPDEMAGSEVLFSRFYEAIIEHYRESREMAYYAKMLNLSAKYFSQLIKSETGTSATEWINTYVIIQAKMLLSSRKDMTVQQISYYLGFSEQASFSRFFKTNTGISPSEYRTKV